MTRRNYAVQEDYSVDTARRVYEMWHKKEPHELLEAPAFAPPKFAYSVGEGLYITYSSDKWEDDGNYYNYIHEFTSGPSLYATTGEILEGEGAYDRVKATSLVPQFGRGYGAGVVQTGFPILASVVSLTYHDGQRKRKIAFKSYKPVLSCTVDRRTLIIFADELLFIHGGDTKVLADGIAY